MRIFELILGSLGFLVLLMSFIPLIKNDYWVFRVFEYPRVQKLLIVFLILGGYSFVLLKESSLIHFIIPVLLVINAFYLIYQILPFTPVAKKQLLHAKHHIPEQDITLVTANVFQYNRNVKPYVETLLSANPDLILLLETDSWWDEQTAFLKFQFPFNVKVPLENTYGMLLYSKYPIKESNVHFLVEKDIPSVHAIVELPCKKLIQLYCVHPTPPVPNENPRSTERDKELLIVAKLAKSSRQPVIVLGDLNDVAWSYTTALFCKMSGLLDPRRGRGFFNTFHAWYPFLRFPLDHIFCSTHFKLLHISRLPANGSDHFPMYAKLQYEVAAVAEQEEPQPDAEERELAEEKVSKQTGS